MEEKIKELKNKIAFLKLYLHNTDYITDKFTEAIVEYIISGDKSRILELYDKYQSTIEQRETWRAEINELQAKLEELKAEEEENGIENN